MASGYCGRSIVKALVTRAGEPGSVMQRVMAYEGRMGRLAVCLNENTCGCSTTSRPSLSGYAGRESRLDGSCTAFDGRIQLVCDRRWQHFLHGKNEKAHTVQ